MNQPAVLITPPPAPSAVEPPFFRETWKLLLASATERFRYIWADKGVASVTDGKVVLRAEKSLPTGFYLFDALDNYVPVRVHNWVDYPNIDAAQPPFEKMRPFCQLSNQHVQQLLSFVEHARQQKSHVVIDPNGLCLQRDQKICINMPLGEIREQVLDPDRFRLALREMLRYSDCYLSQEANGFGQDAAPIVLGRNWAQCALIAPGHSYSYGRY